VEVRTERLAFDEFHGDEGRDIVVVAHSFECNKAAQNFILCLAPCPRKRTIRKRPATRSPGENTGGDVVTVEEVSGWREPA
jgi:hypothetical protein